MPQFGRDFRLRLRVRLAAGLRSDACHPRAGKAVEHHITGLGVVKDEPHDRGVRHLRRIRVRLVERVALSNTDVRSERARINATFVARSFERV